MGSGNAGSLAQDAARATGVSLHAGVDALEGAARTKFNGFGAEQVVWVIDEPMESLYTGEVEQERRSATVTKLF